MLMCNWQETSLRQYDSINHECHCWLARQCRDSSVKYCWTSQQLHSVVKQPADGTFGHTRVEYGFELAAMKD